MRASLVVPCVVAAVVAPLCLTTFLAVGPAAATPAAPTAAASPSDAACTLSHSLTHPGGESGSCVGVGARLSALPAVGRTATLTVTVRATRDIADVRVTVDLPATFVFADGTASADAVTGAGKVHRATIATVHVTSGSTHTYTREVRAVATGPGAIVANAAGAARADDTDSGTDSVFVTVGRSASAAGADVNRDTIAAGATTSTSVVAAAAAEGSAPARPHVRVAAAASPATQVPAGPATAGTSCVTGHWYFTDRTGATVGGYDTIVEVMRGSTVLTINSVAYDGSYTSCFASGGTTQSVYVKFLESNNAWRVTNTAADTDYSFNSGTVTVADGTTYDLGGLLPTDVTARRAVHAYWDAAIEYDWIYSNAPLGSGCWSPYATTCYQLVIHWQADATDGPIWRAGQGVFLPASTPDYPDEPVHEYGHALMYGIYGNTFPSAPNCKPHYLPSTSSAGCAWTEGFADWVTTAVWNHTLYTYGDGTTFDFNTTWGDGHEYGDQVECRVVQAMDSLLDGVKAPWDNDPGVARGRQNATQVFRVMQDKPWDFSGFWADWANIGYEDDATTLGALYQGTIDYGFRNPLADGQVYAYPIPYPGNHNYSFTTTQDYWSVVAVKGNSPVDVDLSLFTDAQQTNNLGTSNLYGPVDFVAINSNSGARTLQTYYPRVTLRTGSNLPYQIMARQGASVFSSGTLSSPLGAGQPFANWDTYQQAGVPVYIRAVPVPGQTVGLSFLQPGAAIVARPSAANSATSGKGQAASLVVTPTATGYGGLVLTNEGLTAGAPWVYEDTTAPTGTLSIDGGASSTTNTNATLALSASDPDTGVDAMQISTDGTFDTEPVLPYSTSAKVSLDDKLDGAVNIGVRYRNQAGMWSAPIVSTIELEARPTITSVTPDAGPRSGGTSITIHGRRLTGIQKLTVGNVAATQVVYVDDSTLTAVVPARAPGTYDVRATVQSGSSVLTSADHFTYYAAPTVTSLSPAVGPKAGGTVVTVNGTDFVGVTGVVIGETQVAFTVLSPTQLQFTTPAGSGHPRVRVTAVGGTSLNAAAAAFAYH